MYKKIHWKQLKELLWELYRKLHVKCQDCKDGRMFVVHVHVYDNGSESNIYQCDKCDLQKSI
jgi:hypothetical protein